jgi:ATP-dependent RNA helicase RhlE
MTFELLGLAKPLLSALEKEGYTTPTPIQEQSIPLILEGKDLLGCAQTGTGKTAAFALPILQLLDKNPTPKGKKRPIRSLILTPTRELALQIKESFDSYGKYCDLKNQVIFGGVGQQPQTDALQRGTDILVATPGRLLDLMGQGYVNLQHIEIFVLDEADRMLDMGFVHDVKRVIAKLPHRRQSLFFSATMAAEILHLAGTILNDPSKVQVTPVSSTAETVQQGVYFVEKEEKKKLLIHLLQNPLLKSVLVFTRTKHGANRLVTDLAKAGIEAEAIHGNKSQTARQRALTNFKNKTLRVLIATDIAARGIDVDDLSHVVNYELPNIPETYVHRIGRTGRAGASGIAYSFCDSEEREYLRDIQKIIAMQVPKIGGHPYESTDNEPIAYPSVRMINSAKKALAPTPANKTENRAMFGNRSNSSQNKTTSGNGDKKHWRPFSHRKNKSSV